MVDAGDKMVGRMSDCHASRGHTLAGIAGIYQMSMEIDAAVSVSKSTWSYERS